MLQVGDAIAAFEYGHTIVDVAQFIFQYIQTRADEARGASGGLAFGLKPFVIIHLDDGVKHTCSRYGGVVAIGQVDNSRLYSVHFGVKAPLDVLGSIHYLIFILDEIKSAHHLHEHVERGDVPNYVRNVIRLLHEANVVESVAVVVGRILAKGFFVNDDGCIASVEVGRPYKIEDCQQKAHSLTGNKPPPSCRTQVEQVGYCYETICVLVHAFIILSAEHLTW